MIEFYPNKLLIQVSLPAQRMTKTQGRKILDNYEKDFKDEKHNEQDLKDPADEIVVADCDVQAGGEDTSGVFDVNGKIASFEFR